MQLRQQNPTLLKQKIFWSHGHESAFCFIQCLGSQKMADISPKLQMCLIWNLTIRLEQSTKSVDHWNGAFASGKPLEHGINLNLCFSQSRYTYLWCFRFFSGSFLRLFQIYFFCATKTCFFSWKTNMVQCTMIPYRFFLSQHFAYYVFSQGSFSRSCGSPMSPFTSTIPSTWPWREYPWKPRPKGFPIWSRHFGR